MKNISIPNKASYAHLTKENRIELAILKRSGLKQKDIARILGKDISTISRELKRNFNEDSIIGYSPSNAQNRTEIRRIKANQRFRIIENDEKLRKFIVKKLKKFWSPEQIAGRLKKEFDRTLVCHETIYQYIYNSKPYLKRHLRCKKGKYRRRYGSKILEKQREEAKKKRIDLRPEIVEQRGRIGDWEGDTILGKDKNHILTHAERKSGILFADKLQTVTAEETRMKTIERFKNIPRRKKCSLTYDNGSTFADYEFTERETGIDIYFAYPYHSWERGTNENANGLLRQFFPKKSAFANITQEEIDKAVRLINHRPRKRLNYLTPYEVFYEKEINCALG